MFAKTFRNTLFASSLLIGTSLLAGPAALAVDGAGTATGTIAEVNTVSFVGVPAAITNGVEMDNFDIGDLNVQNNAAAGWTLAVSSGNAGKLVNGAHSITYTNLTTGNIGDSISAEVTPIVGTPSGQLHTSAFDAVVAAGVTNVSVTVDIGAGQFVPVGSYTDLLTFTLTSSL